MFDCECSEEYGPCERHGELLAQRDGASSRTADELTLVLIDDLISVGAELSPWGKDIVEQAEAQLNDDPIDSRWLEDPDLVDALMDVADQAEAYVADLWVIRDDGYRIVRPLADCPL